MVIEITGDAEALELVTKQALGVLDAIMRAVLHPVQLVHPTLPAQELSYPDPESSIDRVAELLKAVVKASRGG